MTVDPNSLEGINLRLARAAHEAKRIGTQRHMDTLALMRRHADWVFHHVSEKQFQKARGHYNAFGKLWEDAPQDTKGATYHPDELRRVILVAEKLAGGGKAGGR